MDVITPEQAPPCHRSKLHCMNTAKKDDASTRPITMYLYHSEWWPAWDKIITIPYTATSIPYIDATFVNSKFLSPRVWRAALTWWLRDEGGPNPHHQFSHCMRMWTVPSKERAIAVPWPTSIPQMFFHQVKTTCRRMWPGSKPTSLFAPWRTDYRYCWINGPMKHALRNQKTKERKRERCKERRGNGGWCVMCEKMWGREKGKV